MRYVNLSLCAAVVALIVSACGGGGGGPVIPGGNNAPVALFSASPVSGVPPLEVDFDASASSDSDGSIVTYEWDFDGNGAFEVNSGAVATASHIYPSAGSFNVRLRVTDDDGAQATRQQTITVSSPVGPIDIPPVETLTLDAGPFTSSLEWWRENFYHTLPDPAGLDRAFQNESITAWADEILRLTNIERTTRGLSPLVREEHLEHVIQAHVRDMALRDYFEHETADVVGLPNPVDPFDRLDAVEHAPYAAAGENIAANQPSPAELLEAWMNSPGHRANILNADFERIGIGVYYDAGPGTFQLFYGQLFARFGGDPSAHDWIEIGEGALP